MFWPSFPLPLIHSLMKVKLLTWVWLFATPWTVAYQVPLSMDFSRQENWSGLPFPSLVDLPKPGIEPKSPALQSDASPSELSEKPPFSYEHTSNKICIFTTALKLYFSELQMVTYPLCLTLWLMFGTWNITIISII